MANLLNQLCESTTFAGNHIRLACQKLTVDATTTRVYELLENMLWS